MRSAVTATLLLILTPAVFGQDQPKSYASVAEKVLAAFKAKDQKALKALVSDRQPGAP